MSHYLTLKKNPPFRSFYAIFTAIATFAFISVLFAGQAHAVKATISWDDVSVAGYKVHYGKSSGNYTSTINVGNATTYTVKAITGPSLYIALSAYDSSKQQSGLSSELAIDKVVATAGSHGSISPSGKFFRTRGTTQTFTITPAAGRRVAAVLVNGVSVGAVSSYTVTVSGKQTISATFAAASSSADTATPSALDKSTSASTQASSASAGSTVQASNTGTNRSTTASVTTAGTGETTSNSSSTSSKTSTAPVADAGPDQIVKSGAEVTLNGSNSTGASSGIASYKWTQTSGPNVKLSNASAAVCTFAAPEVSNGKLLKFQLEVTNNAGATASSSCFVNVSANDTVPLADAGSGQAVSPFTIVTLNDQGTSGPNNSYKWVQVSGPAVQINDANTNYASFVAPNPGTSGASMVFQLQVSDHLGLTTTDSTAVSVVNDNQPPVADAGLNQTDKAGATITLDGSGSRTSDGSTLTYRWKQLRGVPVTLSDPTSVAPTFTAPSVAGTDSPNLLFMLTVTDTDSGLSSTAECTVTISQ